MEPYRKPDQYYIDSYDRRTIEELKELEKNERKPLREIKKQKGLGTYIKCQVR